jgi:hypothetical protein
MEEIWNQNWQKKLYVPPGQSYYKIFYVNKKNGEFVWGKPFDIDGNPLPKGWERVYSTNKKKYYYLNTNTNKTQFKKPLFTQNNYSASYSPRTYSLALAKPSIPEIIDDEPHIRTLSGKDVNENQIPDYEDSNLLYRSRSGNRTYLHNLPARPNGEPETIFIHEICCDREYTQFPSRFCAETYSHTLAAHASYIVGSENKSLDGFVEIRNSKANRACPTYESFEFIRKKDKTGYRKALKQALLPFFGWRPVVQDQDDHNLSDHDAIILNLQFEKSLENMPFNIISMNLEGLCKVKKDDKYRYIEYMNSYFYPHIKVGTIMVFQEVILKHLVNTLYRKDVFEIDEAGNQILKVLQKDNPDIQLKFISDTYTSGILYDTSVWNISDVRPISRLYHGELESKFSNAYLFTSKEGSCEFWVVNIHLKAPFGTDEYIADITDALYTGESNNVINMHIIELNNIVRTLKEASLNFEIPVYLCGDYNNEISKAYLVKKAIESLDDFYDPNG